MSMFHLSELFYPFLFHQNVYYKHDLTLPQCLARKKHMSKKNTFQSEISYRTKKFLTIIFSLLISLFFIYLFFCDGVLVETKITDNAESLYTIEDTFHRVDYIYLAQWAIIISLAAIVWIWRTKFGITGFAGIQGDSPTIEPATYDSEVDQFTVPKKGDASISVGTQLAYKDNTPLNHEEQQQYSESYVSYSNESEVEDNTSINSKLQFKQTAAKIQKLLTEYNALSTHKIAVILGLKQQTVRKIIRIYPQFFRRNGNGPNSVITNAQSKDNIIIDSFIENDIQDEIISDMRPARISSSINKNENIVIDAVIKTVHDIYLLETKESLRYAITSEIIYRCQRIAKEFTPLTTHIIIIITKEPKEMDLFNKTRNSILSKFNDSSSEIQILLSSEIGA